MATRERKKILILGGGFGGIHTAISLSKSLKNRDDFEIALVNEENYTVFQPMLAEVISGTLGLFDVVVPIRDLCPNISLYLREIESIDLDRRRVLTSHPFRAGKDEIEYDHLVLSLGLLENFSIVRGLSEHGFHFKNLGDALVLRNHLIQILEQADVESNEESRRQMLTFVMAGGGFSGVEAIAEINDYVRGVARRYRNLKPEEIKIVLIHSGPRILPELPESLSTYAQKILERKGLDISLNTRLSAVTAEEALLNDGTRVPTKTVVATIGGTPNPVIQALACENERGRILVDQFLEVPNHPGLWAVGDCAHIIDAKKGTPCPPTAQYAVREGKCVAENILAAMDGKEKRPFSFSTLGMMGSLGHQNAVGSVLGIRISGMLAWFIWRTIYWTKLPGFNRKFKVGISWFLNFLFRHDIAHLNVTPSQNISREHFEAGKVVFREGDSGDRVYIIVDGEAEAVRQSANGNEEVLTKMQKGDCFGEIALITDAPRTATVRTVTNLDVISLHRASFGTLFSCLPQLRDAFERMMDERKSRDEERNQNSNQG